MDPFTSTPLRAWKLETNHDANGDRHHRLSAGSECWRAVRCLGSGSFGDVWQETCLSGPSQNAVRAVKCLGKRQAKFTEMSRRELEALITFSNSDIPKYKEHFVQFLGWFDDTAHFYLAMEFLEYGDLQKYITKPFPEPEAAMIVTQVAQALQYMHQKNFVHRDIKPLNILISRPGPRWHVKIADFGISKNVEGTVLGTHQLGSPGYMAPELFGDSSHSYTAAVDVWALGAVAYCMRTGFPPLRTTKQLLDYARDHRTQFPVRPLGTSSGFCMNFVLGTMAEAPERRLTIEQVLAHDWLSIQLDTAQDGYLDGSVTAALTAVSISASNAWSNTYSSTGSQQSQISSLTTPAMTNSQIVTDVEQGQYTGTENGDEKTIGGNDSNIIQGMADLATRYYDKKMYGRSEKIGEEVVDMRQELLGVNHPDTVKAMLSLARTYLARERYDKAENVYVKVVDIRREMLGDKHPHTLTVMKSLTATYYEQKKYDLAEKTELILCNLQREELGNRHPDTIHSMKRLGMTYLKQNKLDEAEEIYLELVFLRRDMLGNKHADTIDAMMELAITYGKQKRYNRAAKFFVEAIKLREEVLGGNHPDTIDAKAKLVALRQEQGQLAEIKKEKSLQKSRTFSKPVFRVALERLYDRDGVAVPLVLLQCFQAVELFGLDLEGIYRFSGSANHLNRLKDQFDVDASRVDLTNPENFFHDINSVAALVKEFFHDLPEPVFVSMIYSQFIDAARIDDDIQRRDSIHALINTLPDANYATLRATILASA
ncbi:kinase-like domain-containing protein [Penicillium macrosclerotiorum]|uniref:kinase-like domain-containing protein n=1 Tax=Penicillium macrosclerotiorum TaxID=303699 RepID=UPI0025471DA9|nr:kinase-like domain-containing protein [Penicillium macrosclerotiorum]KAJ5669752.1 kinase-like domain-containing protein [Penicillium macrosclerotiorum]